MSERRPYRHYTAERLAVELQAAQRKLMSLQSETQQRIDESSRSGGEWAPGYSRPPKVTAPSATVGEWLDHTPAASLRGALGASSPRAITPADPVKSFQDGIIAGATKAHAEREAVRQALSPEPAAKPLTDGFYARPNADGVTIFKVVWNQAETNLYAKQLFVETVPAEDGHPEIHRAHWGYAPGAVKSLTLAMKLTEEQAAEFGKLYGVCCICSARLTNEESIERGIGPVCADKQGW